MKRNVDLQGSLSLAQSSGCQISKSESCKFEKILLFELMKGGRSGCQVIETRET